MTAADILILAVLAVSVLLGLLHGFVGAVLSLVCWAAAFWVAWVFGHEVAGFYGNWLHQPTAAIIAGYVTCFLGVLVVGALLGWAVRRLMDRGGLRGDDRILGALFGLVRGFVVVTFVVLMLGFTALPREPAWRQSVLLPPFEVVAAWAAQALPPDVTHYFEIGGKSLSALPRAPISPGQPAAASANPADGAPPASASTSANIRQHGRTPGDVGQ